MSRFVFLDRDGTLVRDPGYVHRIEDYALLPGVVEGLRLLADAGWRLAIVTNQSGIGRGLFREEDFAAFEAHLERDLAARGVPIERSYHCPHRPDAGCACRKPGTALLERARIELGATLEQSWVIGDGDVDVELARRAGCRGAIRIRPRGGAAGGDTPEARDLETAARLLLVLGDERE